MKDFRLAICQNKPSKDKRASIKKAESLISEAADKGAQLVLLPEIFYYPYELGEISRLEEATRDTINKLREAAKQNKVYLCSGSTVEREGKHRFNKSVLINPAGEVILEYSKIHLFDVNYETLKTKESLVFDAGNSISTADTELGRIGIMICYDIRFPELARFHALHGAEIMLVPAAFNVISGEAHWDIFTRCRAAENQVFLAAACPARDMKSKYVTYGHSRIVDPWGGVMVEAGIDEGIIFADITNKKLEEIRNRLPFLKHMRKDLYKKILSY